MAEGQINENSVREALQDLKDPETGRSLVKLDQIRDIQITGGQVRLTVALTTHSAPLWDEVQDTIRATITRKLPQLTQVDINREIHTRPPQKLGEIGLTAKSVIAIGSGKGGVGKSTIAASLALSLKRSGAIVGLMDSDVYGPSIPHLLGVSDQPHSVGNGIQPAMMDGMPVMSMGLLVPKEEAVIWRGPMLHGAVTQFLRDTLWGDLDYLIIDMPPGTGDIALSLSQLLPLTGAVVVCTPQEVALLDAVKAIGMFRKVDIPVLGMVENMSGFICPGCQQRYDIFGRGGARATAERLHVPFLGDVPIQVEIRAHGDAGRTLANFDNPAIAAPFDSISLALVKELAERAATEPVKPSLPVLG